MKLLRTITQPRGRYTNACWIDNAETTKGGVGIIGRQIARLVLVAFCALMALQAEAHRLGESYVYVSVTDTSLNGRVEITPADIHKVIPIDDDGDGNPTGAEALAHAADVIAHLEARFSLRLGDAVHPPIFGEPTLVDLGVSEFAQFHFSVPSLTTVPDRITVRYQYLFDGPEPNHRGLLVIENNTRTEVEDNESQVALIFGPDGTEQSLRLDALGWQEAIWEFIKIGAWHIWIGFDHILFVITLLLPSVLMRRDQRWVPADRFKTAFWYVLRIITLFTVAHSISLALAALDIVRLPVQLVEAVIALSIAVAALDNIFHFFKRYIWVVVLVFGFFHGFGFANVLSPIGLPPARIRTSLLGFNIGVELGQIAVICVVFPVLFTLRQQAFYRPAIVIGGSVLLILIALYWFAERTFFG
ncbi:MAG: HupE/UreJ family protein [Pseudomonadota bacterium]